jgi:hypothetical protein
MKCPNCRNKINAFKIRGKFLCHKCNKKLEAKFWPPFIWWLIIYPILASGIELYVFEYEIIKESFFSFLLIEAIVGISLLYLLLELFTKINIEE